MQKLRLICYSITFLCLTWATIIQMATAHLQEANDAALDASLYYLRGQTQLGDSMAAKSEHYKAKSERTLKILPPFMRPH